MRTYKHASMLLLTIVICRFTQAIDAALQQKGKEVLYVLVIHLSDKQTAEFFKAVTAENDAIEDDAKKWDWTLFTWVKGDNSHQPGPRFRHEAEYWYALYRAPSLNNVVRNIDCQDQQR